MLRKLTLWIRFAVWPFFTIGLLFVLEFPKMTSDVHATFPAFLMKCSVALAGYAIGSVAPYLFSDEYLYMKFGAVSDNQGDVIITFHQKDRTRFDFLKALILVIFATGLIIWFANLYLPDVLRASPFPLVTQYFWTIGLGYWLASGILYVHLRTPH